MRAWHCLALITAAVLLTYSGSLKNGLVGFDDSAAVSGSRGGGDAARGWAAELASDPLRAVPRLVLRRQLTSLSKGLDFMVWGDDWWGHHLTSVLLHLGASWLAFSIAAALLGSAEGGLAAALVFALHPVQVESVAYLAGRRDVLSGLLCLLSFRWWLRSLDGDKRGAKAVAAAAWLAAMAAKQSAVALPALWFAGAWARRPAEGPLGAWRRNRWLWGALAGGVACVIAAHFAEAGRYASGMAVPEAQWHGGSPWRQLTTEPRVILHALGLLVWPARLSADYNGAFTPSDSLTDPRTLGACLGLLAAGVLALLGARRSSLAAFAAVWIAATYAPMIHLLPTTHNLESFAEHWLYLPVFGIGLLAAMLFVQAHRRAPKAAWGVLACLALTLGARSTARARVWRDDLTFWTQAARDCPACARPRGGLAEAWRVRGRDDEAERLLAEAIALDPTDPRQRISLAAIQLESGRLDQAKRTLREARDIPLGRTAFDGPIQYQLALIELRQGQPLKALVRSSNVPYDRAHLRGYAHFLLRRYDRAEHALRRALSTNPHDVAILADLANVLLIRGGYDEAARFLERAESLAPSRADILVNLGKAHTERKDYAAAHRRLARATHLAPRYAPAWLALSELDRRRGFAAAAQNSSSTAAYQALSAALATKPRKKARP